VVNTLEEIVGLYDYVLPGCAIKSGELAFLRQVSESLFLSVRCMQRTMLKCDALIGPSNYFGNLIMTWFAEPVLHVSGMDTHFVSKSLVILAFQLMPHRLRMPCELRQYTFHPFIFHLVHIPIWILFFLRAQRGAIAHLNSHFH
jgi:hypothetical protein